MIRTAAYLLLFALVFSACGSGEAEAQSQVKTLSQYQSAGLSDMLIDKAGTFHVVYLEEAQYGKPRWVWYTTSTNRGATWSKPITLSNDGTGNGAGQPQILQDGSGAICALWKRYGSSTSTYPITSSLLDGPGGIEMGTVFYKVLQGGSWSQQVKIGEQERAQSNWFATVAPDGRLVVGWFQMSPESVKNNISFYTHADYMRLAVLTGTTPPAIVDMNTPEPPEWAGGYPKAKGGWNLQGYVDKNNLPHMLWVDKDNGPEVIKYYDGKNSRELYTYPANARGNNFHNPAKLLVDENGVDHMVFMPAAANLEDQQIWDVNLATNQKNVLIHIPESEARLQGVQAYQGPGGQMAVAFQSEKNSSNGEAYGLFYKTGKWTGMGFTNNSKKNSFFSKDFIGTGGYLTNISVATSYYSGPCRVAYDATGKKSMVMLLTEKTLTSFASTHSPSLLFVPIDK